MTPGAMNRDPWFDRSTSGAVGGVRPRARARALALTALTAAVALSAGCGVNLTRGEGAVTSETRDVGDFSRIEAGAGTTVSLRIEPTATLEVRAQENIVPIIVTDVANGTLRIHSSQGYTTNEPVEVVVTTPQLDGIAFSGGTHGTVDGLASDVMDIELSGGSELAATGTASTITLEMSGGSSADLEGLSAGTISVDLSGGGDATVTASDRVQGSAAGGTRLTVLGGAQLSVDTSSDAQVTGG